MSFPDAELSEVTPTKPALAHLDAMRQYLEQLNPGAARNVAVSLKASGASLTGFSHRGRPMARPR
jgi:plasmid stabilization system protein ParE